MYICVFFEFEKEAKKKKSFFFFSINFAFDNTQKTKQH